MTANLDIDIDGGDDAEVEQVDQREHEWSVLAYLQLLAATMDL